MKKIKVLSLFDGMSVAQQALKELGIVNEYYASEIDKYAVATTQSNFPNTVQLGDVCNVSLESYPEINNPDLMIGGSPCFASGTKVMTDNGYVHIEDLKVGDKVLTHKKRYEKIEKVGNKKTKTYIIKAQGTLPIETTAEHPFYVREMKRISALVDGKEINKRFFGEPKWKEVKDLKKHDFIALPILKDGKDTIDEIDAWLLGRYVADGYLRTGKRAGRINSKHHLITFCVGKHKTKSFIDQKKYHVGKCEDRTVFKYRIIDEKLHKLAQECGRGAKNKIIPNFILNGSKKIAESFLKGYMSGDGCYSNSKYKASTVSENLSYSLCLLVAKIYGVGANIDIFKRPPTTIIDGRVVNQSDTFSVCYQKERRKQNRQWTDGEYIWFPVKEVEETNKNKTVYNIQVRRDHTYTANNIVVHNCQDLSIAKKNREGLRGQRSGLFWEAVRIHKEVNPKWFVYENVSSMKKEWKEQMLRAIQEVDHSAYMIEINAALVSAQNRKRVFFTNIPVEQPKDRGILLKDILEENVDEKYYLSQKELNYMNRDSGRYSDRWSFCNNSEKNKSLALVANLHKGVPYNVIRIGNLNSGGQGDRIYSQDGKSVSLSANGGGRGAKTGLYAVPRKSKTVRTSGMGSDFGDKHNWQMISETRKLTPTECLRLQSMPDDYFDKAMVNNKPLSNTQRYKMTGNAFNCEVIKHIIKGGDW